jgi:hypothetical protein
LADTSRIGQPSLEDLKTISEFSALKSDLGRLSTSLSGHPGNDSTRLMRSRNGAYVPQSPVLRGVSAFRVPIFSDPVGSGEKHDVRLNFDCQPGTCENVVIAFVIRLLCGAIRQTTVEKHKACGGES